jgi:hypothetical protein
MPVNRLIIRESSREYGSKFGIPPRLDFLLVADNAAAMHRGEKIYIAIYIALLSRVFSYHARGNERIWTKAEARTGEIKTLKSPGSFFSAYAAP